MGERWLVCWFVCCCSPLAHSHTRALTSDSLSILSSDSARSLLVLYHEVDRYLGYE